MSPANAPKRQNPSPATDAGKKVTSPANAQTKSPMVVAGVLAVAAADTLAAEDKNATNVVKLVTSLATATKVEEATRVVAVGVAMAEAMAAVTAAVEEEEAVVKLATPVVDLDTCHVIAPKARSATTVSNSPRRDSG